MKLALLRPYYGLLQLYLYSELAWGSTEKLISFNDPRTLETAASSSETRPDHSFEAPTGLLMKSDQA